VSPRPPSLKQQARRAAARPREPGLAAVARQVGAERAAADRVRAADERTWAARSPEEAARWRRRGLAERRALIRALVLGYLSDGAGTAIVVRLDRFLAEREEELGAGLLDALAHHLDPDRGRNP